MSTYTPDSVHRLLQSLAAPGWTERRAADSLLFQLFAACGGDAPHADFAALVDAATARFGARRDAFLAHLFAFHCNTAALAFAARTGGGAWRPLDAGIEFAPADAPAFGAFDMYGLGTGWYLRSQAAHLRLLVPALTHALQHPEPTVADTAWKMLGAIPDAAAPAFADMLQIACERGPHFAPGAPMRDLARIADAHPACAAALIDALDVGANDARIDAVCAIAGALAAVPPELFAALSAALRATDVPAHRYALLRALADASARSRLRDIDTLLATARRYAQSAVALERAASAWALTRLGTPEADAPRLLALLADADWIVRSNAAAAAATWTPSADVVVAVARLLGDEEGHDGYPHANVLPTLIAWGPHAAPAVPQIARWLPLDEPDHVDVDAVATLLDALGAHGRPLAGAIAALLAERYPRDGDGADEIERFEHDDGSADAAAFAGDDAAPFAPWNDEIADLQRDLDAIACDSDRLQQDTAALIERLGFDPAEPIPGSPPAAHDDSHDAETKLRRWLASMP